MQSSYSKVKTFAKSHRNNVTAWEPSPGDIRVFDWSCHTLLAKGSNWDSVAETLGLNNLLIYWGQNATSNSFCPNN